jgi:hypothetical protein
MHFEKHSPDICNGYLNFPVYTISMVFSDVLFGEQVKAAVLPVIARKFLTHGDVFQTYIPAI